MSKVITIQNIKNPNIKENITEEQWAAMKVAGKDGKVMANRFKVVETKDAPKPFVPKEISSNTEKKIVSPAPLQPKEKVPKAPKAPKPPKS